MASPSETVPPVVPTTLSIKLEDASFSAVIGDRRGLDFNASAAAAKALDMFILRGETFVSSAIVNVVVAPLVAAEDLFLIAVDMARVKRLWWPSVSDPCLVEGRAKWELGDRHPDCHTTRSECVQIPKVYCIPSILMYKIDGHI